LPFKSQVRLIGIDAKCSSSLEDKRRLEAMIGGGYWVDLQHQRFFWTTIGLCVEGDGVSLRLASDRWYVLMLPRSPNNKYDQQALPKMG